MGIFNIKIVLLSGTYFAGAEAGALAGAPTLGPRLFIVFWLGVKVGVTVVIWIIWIIVGVGGGVAVVIIVLVVIGGVAIVILRIIVFICRWSIGFLCIRIVVRRRRRVGWVDRDVSEEGSMGGGPVDSPK